MAATPQSAPLRSHRVAVLGSGIIGLSTAVCIARSITDVSVTVISDRPWQETTSYGAGGLWMPYSLGQTAVLVCSLDPYSIEFHSCTVFVNLYFV